MTKPLENHEFASELRQLLVAVALGDATDTQIGRLNGLLLHDERLRRQAARFFEEETVLRREFNVLERVGEFHKTLAKEPASESTLSSVENVGCESRTFSSALQRLSLAVAVLIGASIGIIWIAGRARNSAIDQSADEVRLRPLQVAESVNIASQQQGLPSLVASILTPVTHVSWSGPQFASELNSGPPTSTMRDGVISFMSAFGRPARGYMVCLQPAALLDLVVAGDAEGENALAVIEFDASGRPTGRRISFSNSAGKGTSNPTAVGKFSPMTKKGRLGVWSERNDTAAPQYYLFTGVHKLLNRSADDSWHVSNLSAFVEEPGLLHIGWDDSGMPAVGDTDLLQFPDYDFDDVTATIRIKRSSPEPDRRAADIHIYSKTARYEDKSNQPSATESDRYRFSVAPGQAAIVKVCSRSGAPVEIAVFEKDSDKLRWHCRKEKLRSPTLGICAIENDTSQPREFYVVGQKKRLAANAHQSLLPLSHSVLFEQEGFVTVGFGDDQLVSDFDQVRVDILTVDKL
jgi:hypothetical protein